MKKHRVSLPFVVSGVFLLFLVLALIAYIPVGAQQTTFPSDPTRELDERIKLFFNDILRGNTSKAFEDLFHPLSGSEPLAGMRVKLEDAKEQFGMLRNYERIDSRAVGEDLVFVWYLLKYDKHPVTWTFTFYRRPVETGMGVTSSNPWLLIGLRFDTNLDPLLL